ncbi:MULTISPECIES: energy transducer TonB [Niastella]|uniref:Carboxypeptidase-like regulatory domain-containing protein n=1 Tax=Niastella soli TaxID=2821487 RepID=A0ABS3Z4D5_9BACT|nr:carboxypeptidase-like regulatory domain-containing protein [Niastella soli]MBO9205024.1 carboxypeptidase-like regulatory domain-containing protein [Niastella soli]
MSDHKDHIIHYTAADIQRYVQGKLSAREMHAMEKAALDDPFLADAMEGMQQAFEEHDENLVTGQLQQLQQQFQTRTAPAAKVVAFKPFRYWQAAAAAVLVIITGVWIYSLVNDSRDEKSPSLVVAQTKAKETQQPEPAPVLQDGKETALSTDSAPAKSIERGKTVAPTPRVYRDQQANEGVVANKKAAEIPTTAPARKETFRLRSKTDTITLENKAYWGAVKEANDEAVAKQEIVAPPVAAAAAPEYKRAQKESAYNNANKERETELITIGKGNSPKKTTGVDKNLTGVIKGKVTDQNNNPIANAYVQIPKNNNNFITDKSGLFKIPASDSVVDVAVNVLGYGTQSFTLENNANMNQLQLQPANATYATNDNIAYNGRYRSATVNKLPNNIVYDAEPVGGWIAFGQYLEKNKKIAPSGNGSIGQVIVSFEVNKKGTLSEFKIEQSLSKACDDEAIRLIMQGPSWKFIKKVRKARVTVIVRF